MSIWSRIKLSLLPKDIKQELKRGIKDDLSHLKQLGLVEDCENGVKITPSGRACFIQTQHMENKSDK